MPRITSQAFLPRGPEFLFFILSNSSTTTFGITTLLYSLFSSSINCEFLSNAEVSGTATFSPLKNCSVCDSDIPKALQYFLAISNRVFSVVFPPSTREIDDLFIPVPGFKPSNTSIFFAMSSMVQPFFSRSSFNLEQRKAI